MRGTLRGLGGPYNKDTIWGTILGSPIFGNSQMRVSENGESEYSTLNSRTLIIRTPKIRYPEPPKSSNHGVDEAPQFEGPSRCAHPQVSSHNEASA